MINKTYSQDEIITNLFGGTELIEPRESWGRFPDGVLGIELPLILPNGGCGR